MSEELNKAILTALAQHTSYLHRAATTEVNAQIKAFDSIMDSKIEKLATILRNLNAAERDSMAAGQYNTDRLKRLKSLLSGWQGELSNQLYSSFEESAIALATHESAYVAKIAGESAAVAISGEKIYQASKRVPVVGGQLVEELFKSLAIATAESVRNNIREGIANGWTNDQILRAIKGSEDVPSEPSVARQMKIEVERTIRTSRMHVSNTAYIETYQAIGYTHVKYVSTLDSKTSRVCASRDSNVYDINSNFPTLPAHPNCRSVYVGCDEDGKLIGRRPFVADEKGRSVKDIPKDERNEKIGQVNANTSYAKWFAEQDKDFQKFWLGKTKFKLYSEGKMELKNFVDPTGKELTIAELREMDASLFKRLGL